MITQAELGWSSNKYNAALSPGEVSKYKVTLRQISPEWTPFFDTGYTILAATTWGRNGEYPPFPTWSDLYHRDFLVTAGVNQSGDLVTDVWGNSGRVHSVAGISAPYTKVALSGNYNDARCAALGVGGRVDVYGGVGGTMLFMGSYTDTTIRDIAFVANNPNSDFHLIAVCAEADGRYSINSLGTGPTYSKTRILDYLHYKPSYIAPYMLIDAIRVLAISDLPPLATYTSTDASLDLRRRQGIIEIAPEGVNTIVEVDPLRHELNSMHAHIIPEEVYYEVGDVMLVAGYTNYTSAGRKSGPVSGHGCDVYKVNTGGGFLHASSPTPIILLDDGEPADLTDAHIAVACPDGVPYLCVGSAIYTSVPCIALCNGSTTEDISDYVDSVSIQAAQIRSASIALASPNRELLSSPHLLAKNCALRVSVEAGYYDPVYYRDVLVPVFSGDVTSISSDLHNVSIEAQDDLGRLNRTKSFETHELQAGVAVYDNFYEAGSLALKNTAVKLGNWVGLSGSLRGLASSSPSYVPEDGIIESRGVAFSTLASKTTRGFATVKIQSIVDGGTDTYLLSGLNRRDAGIVFHGIDKDNYKAVYADKNRALRLLVRRLGSDTDTSLGASVNQPWLGVRFTEGWFEVYQSSDGKTWSLVGSRTVLAGRGNVSSTSSSIPVPCGSVGYYFNYKITGVLNIKSKTQGSPEVHQRDIGDIDTSGWIQSWWGKEPGMGMPIRGLPLTKPDGTDATGWYYKIIDWAYNEYGTIGYCMGKPGDADESQQLIPPQWRTGCFDNSPTYYYFLMRPSSAAAIHAAYYDEFFQYDGGPKIQYSSAPFTESADWFIVPAGTSSGSWAGMGNQIIRRGPNGWLPRGTPYECQVVISGDRQNGSAVETGQFPFIYTGGAWRYLDTVVCFREFHFSDMARVPTIDDGIEILAGLCNSRHLPSPTHSAGTATGITANASWSNSDGYATGTITSGDMSSCGIARLTNAISLPITIDVRAQTDSGIVGIGAENVNIYCVRWRASGGNTIIDFGVLLYGESPSQTFTVHYSVNIGQRTIANDCPLRIHFSPNYSRIKMNSDGTAMSSYLSARVDIGDNSVGGRNEYAAGYEWYKTTPHARSYNLYVATSGVATSTIISVDDIGEMSRPIDWVSVDPDESVASSMARVYLRTNTIVYARYDGDVTAKLRSYASPSVYTIPANDILSAKVDRSLVAPTRLRLSGAWSEEDRLCADPAANGASVFNRIDDPNLTDTSSYGEASDYAAESALGGATRATVAMRSMFLLEPSDVITYASGMTGRRGTPLNKWIVEAIGHSLSKDGSSPSFTTILQLSAIEEKA